ncbi:MAG: serine hydrolase [Pseudomonadota bacterium]|nr:serine hydrolase [Pseudomonadota bacterium]
MQRAILWFVLSAAASAAMGQGAGAPKPVQELMPVSQARDGFTAEQSYRLRQGFSSATAYNTVDQNLYYFLHWEEFLPHHIIRRGGPVRELPSSPDAQLGQVKARTSLGELTLDQLLDDPRSRVQGFIVLHKGRIVYEKYPGMRADDHHLWFSSSKSVAGLLVGLLEAEGKIDVQRPIDAYMPELASTHWRGIRVIDILDMASGLEVAETEESRTDPRSLVNHFFRVELSDTSNVGGQTSDQILSSVGRKSEPGKRFEYSSLNTKMLGNLIERVSGRRLADFLSDRVWSKIGAEHDAMIGLNPWGGASIPGMISSTLRDKARYGLIYTPSWPAVSSERIVPQALIDRTRRECRPELLANASSARASTTAQKDRPRCNSRQWDAIYADGDMYKGGARGQGIYVSPDADYVVAWFSTTQESGWVAYARAMRDVLQASSKVAEKPALHETELASIDLGAHFDALVARRMRMNRAIVDPGASGSVHSHQGRPEIVHVIKGTLTEHQGGTSRSYGPGETFVSNPRADVPHQIENAGREQVEVLLVEIPPP